MLMEYVENVALYAQTCERESGGFMIIPCVGGALELNALATQFVHNMLWIESQVFESSPF